MSIQIVEIAQPSVIDTVAVAQPSTVALVEIRQGPAGDAGSGTNSITSATTSDGTANLSLANVTTATATITGVSVAPTAATTTSTTQLATTAFVQQELASGVAVAKNLEFLAHNGSGATIAKGSIVYINGAVSGNPRITLAQANNDTNSARTIGFAKADIANGANGFVIMEGELENVRTADADGIIGVGIQIYLSPTTPGAFTRTEPSAPNHLVYVGVITRASTGVILDGRILVGIQNGYELNEIHDVAISSPAAKQVIKRNAGNTLWVNEAIVSADVSDATSAANPNTLVLRDGSGGANFAGTAIFNETQISTLFFEDYQASVGATFTYGGTGAADHLIALGAGTTGTALFGAATAAAARTTLGLSLPIAVASGGTGTTNGSITGTGALTFTAGGSNQSINLTPSGSGLINITGNSGNTVIPVFRATNNYNGGAAPGFVNAFECLAPNLSVGNIVYIPLGVSAATNNRAGISFYYAGSGSANNYISFGNFFGATGLVAVFPNGGVAIAASGTPTSPGAGCLSVSGTTASTSTTTGALIVSGGVGIAGNINAGGSIAVTGTVRTGGYTFATLPTPTQGMRTFITDGAALPVYMANAAGGSTVVTPVFYNGTNWINA